MSAIHFNKKCTTLFISILVLGAVKLLLDASRTLHQQTGPTTANTIPARRDDNLAINSIRKQSNQTQYEKTTRTIERYPDGLFRHQQVLKGLVFTESTKMGSTENELSASVTLSVVKSLSDEVIAHVKQIFNDDHNENIYFATIPAMIKQGTKVLVVQRIWLGQFEKMKTKYRSEGVSLNNMFNEWHNSWQENYFYSTVLDENYNQVEAGGILGIPTTTNVKFTYKSDGPMDPRLIQSLDDVYLVFHTWLVDKNSKNQVGGRIHIWDMHRHLKKKLWPHIPLQRTEINWIPLDINGQLYFTYSIDPLRVMKCNKKDGDCMFVHEQDGSSTETFQYSSDHLRGGTPWLEYKYPYYISIAHNVASTYRPNEDFAIYNANLVVLHVEDWRVAYVSRNIEAHPSWLHSEPVIRNHTIWSPFWYPTGLIIQTDDILDISCHLNDASGHILRLRGVKSILEQVISKDMEYNKMSKGSVVRTVQQYVLEATKALYNYTWTFTGDIVGKTVEGKDINV